jgi:hypothetical protein
MIVENLELGESAAAFLAFSVEEPSPLLTLRKRVRLEHPCFSIRFCSRTYQDRFQALIASQYVVGRNPQGFSEGEQAIHLDRFRQRNLARIRDRTKHMQETSE